MSEKESNNEFRFSVYQGNILLCEHMFSADDFNPFTRYSINIREILPKAISKLQKTLSKKNYDVFAEVGREGLTEYGFVDPNSDIEEYDVYGYDLFAYYQEMVSLYPAQYRHGMSYNPQSIVQQIDDKTIRGVECKMGFYINGNPIVERLFYVDGFNPISRWSVDLTNVVLEISDSIFNQIKKIDIKNMWDDYDLINFRGYSISQIRELSPAKREEVLKKLKYN